MFTEGLGQSAINWVKEVTGFHPGILRLAMEPSLLGAAVLEGGPDRKIKLDLSLGVDEARNQIKKKVMQIMRLRNIRETSSNGAMDYLDVLRTQDSISEEEIPSLVVDLLLGGYETTSMLIAVIVKYLSHDPKILSELREEHFSVMQSKPVNARLGWDDYKKMPFTQCIITEGLRLGNTLMFVHRKAIKPIQYKGYEIPAGWKFLPILSAVHLDPSLYPDPQKFDPYRWQNEDVANSKKFMPFGGGKRLCPGSELARVETSIFLHHLVLKYSWSPLMDTDWPMHYPNLDFKDNLRLEIKPIAFVP